VAIVGPSGSGKSTVLKLLLGLYEPDAGEISVSSSRINANADKPDAGEISVSGSQINANADKPDAGEISVSGSRINTNADRPDGEDTLKRTKTNERISSIIDGPTISLMELRSRIAYVPQDSFMFPETIRANLSEKATEAELRRACEHAGILKFIDAQPQGFDTILSESSENISGGQRQRLAIARAYLQNAPVVLFDEATAALDPLTEADVLKAFIETTEGKTVLMVAHKPAAIKACERVVMLDGGKIIADGTHERLLKESPAYAELYKHIEEEALNLIAQPQSETAQNETTQSETAQNAAHPLDTRLTPAFNSTDEEARHA
jgi:ABC-type multidrug transport system fused ATPase/permease subunit